MPTARTSVKQLFEWRPVVLVRPDDERREWQIAEFEAVRESAFPVACIGHKALERVVHGRRRILEQPPGTVRRAADCRSEEDRQRNDQPSPEHV